VSRHRQLVVNSDDLIPVLVAIITKSGVKTLIGTLDYVDRFMWTCSTVDEPFTKTTFEAAVQYITSCDFQTMIRVKRRRDNVSRGSFLGHYNNLAPLPVNEKHERSKPIYNFTPSSTEVSYHASFQQQRSSFSSPNSPSLSFRPSPFRRSFSTASPLSQASILTSPTNMEHQTRKDEPLGPSLTRTSTLRSSFRSSLLKMAEKQRNCNE